MVRIKIFGLVVTISKDNIHIENSYRIYSRTVMYEFLEELKKQLKIACITTETPFNHRSVNSMVNEWVAHNNLYVLHYKTDQTKSVDLDYPQKWYCRLGYWLLSRIAL